MVTNAKRMIQFFLILVNYCCSCDEKSNIVSIFLKIYHGYVIISSFIEPKDWITKYTEHYPLLGNEWTYMISYI